MTKPALAATACGAAVVALTGCNVIFGLGEVASDGGAACPVTAGNLLGPDWTNSSDAKVQTIKTRIDLGGTLTFDARYHGASEQGAGFEFLVNGYPVTAKPLAGTPNGDGFVVHGVETRVTDPRATGDDLEVRAIGSIAIDCATLVYAEPAGTETLDNGWIDSSLGQWYADNGVDIAWAPGKGLCGPGAVGGTLASNAQAAELRDPMNGTWPAGTRFEVGGAVATQGVGGFTLVLHLEYGTNDGDDTSFDIATTDATWGAASGSFSAPRAVVQGQLHVVAPPVSTSLSFLGDCFTVRAILP